MTITIYGYSDDLIVVEGDIREEFTHRTRRDDDDGMIACSNGAVVRIRYDDSGVWRITPISGAEHITVTQAPEDDDDNYSDRATICGDIHWVVHGIAVATR